MVAWTSVGRTALYRLPGTPVVIRKTDAGVYEGRYQFSSATVAEAKGCASAILLALGSIALASAVALF